MTPENSLEQNPRSSHPKTTVTLIDAPSYPLETIYTLWNASRSTAAYELPCELHKRALDDRTLAKEIEDLFLRVIGDAIPIAENLHFTFILDHVSISLREQMVRHRVGVKNYEGIGVDIIPDLGGSTWWSQSMRIMDMGTFASDGAYRLPPGLNQHRYWDEGAKIEVNAEVEYWQAMRDCQRHYNTLLKCGVSAEDAREVLPLGCTHRISWTLNLAALQHIVGKRGCWILQLGLWGPVIKGMVNELAEHVHPAFRQLITPPCMRPGTDTFTGCKFHEDNARRIRGEDNIPPCSLYLNHHHAEASEAEMGAESGKGWEYSLGKGWEYSPQGPPSAASAKAEGRYQKMRESYAQLWGRHPDTGMRQSGDSLLAAGGGA